MSIIKRENINYYQVLKLFFNKDGGGTHTSTDTHTNNPDLILFQFS